MSLSDLNKRRYGDLAEVQKQRCQTMLEDIGKILVRTKGRLTWRQIASSLCEAGVPFVSHVSIVNNVMKLPESEYRTTKIFPSLDLGTRRRRLEWSLNFWVFWNSAVLLTSTKVLLVHMDEKWFYAIVVQRNNKFIPFLGMEEKDVSHAVQKKQHIRKEMFICTTGYLPHNNNISNGGLSFKITMERVGRMTPAKKNSYRRVYNDDNTSFTYPQIATNILRRKGELYFESMEVNATNEGTVSNQKYSLMKFFKDIEIPNLEQLTNQLSLSFNCRVVVRYQMDSAGPHTNKTLTNFLENEFVQRDWMLVRQPSQSPLTNVKDTCIFPSLSKAVTWNQSEIYNNKVLDGEDVCVMNAYNTLTLDTVARAYLGHHQIVNAIVKDNGGDAHMRESGGLHCNVRRNSLILYENDTTTPSGIFVAEEENGETVEEQARKWKYATPDVSHHDITKLNKTELNFLERHLPRESDLWQKIAAHNLAEEYSDEEEEEEN